MKELSIQLLTRKIAFERDQSAYRTIFIHFYKPLFNFATSLVKSREVAEEIVSDVMMKLWEMKEGLVNVLNLNVYLFTAIKNRAFNHLTRSKRFSTTDIDNINMEVDQSLFAEDPAGLLETKEVRVQLFAAIKNLPPKCRMVYKLVREQGLSYKQVSAIMEISENTVDRHLNNALHKIVRAVRVHLC